MRRPSSLLAQRQSHHSLPGWVGLSSPLLRSRFDPLVVDGHRDYSCHGVKIGYIYWDVVAVCGLRPNLVWSDCDVELRGSSHSIEHDTMIGIRISSRIIGWIGCDRTIDICIALGD